MQKKYHQRSATIRSLTRISFKRTSQQFEKYGRKICVLVRQANEVGQLHRGKLLDEAVEISKSRLQILRRIKFQSAFMNAHFMESK